MKKNYTVIKCSESNIIDADWNKPFWQKIEHADINLPHWPVQCKHNPTTKVKLQYDTDNLYVIFQVQDCYILSVASKVNGEVWKDSCVEFFFSPNPSIPNTYINLECNCSGVLLAQYHTGPRFNSNFFEVADCSEIKIATTFSGPAKNEITTPVEWNLEYAIPFDLLEKYVNITRPSTGVKWLGNFYKCADDCSYPHWITWSPIAAKQPDFHMPEYFGTLEFA